MTRDHESLKALAEQCGIPRDSARLLAWDANSVHGFVFDTTNAAAVRGASHLLKDLDDQLRDGRGLKLKANQILFAGGGSGLAIVEKDRISEVARKLHDLYARKTRVATCTYAAVNATGDFKEHYNDVQGELARERTRSGPDASPAVPFFVQRCEVCGHRAAAIQQDRKSGTRPECLVCHHCIQAGKSNRWAEKETSDFETIADPKGFLAVVYIDGNGIGSRISRLPTPQAYRTFSKALTEIFTDSFDEIVKQFGLKKDDEIDPDDKRQGKAYQRPICGGDDLVAILPGHVAMPLARRLLERIETAADGHEGLRHEAFKDLDPIGAAAGVAIGKVNFPIRHLLEEAEELLGSAKQRVYRDKVRSALDFAEIGDGTPRRESAKPERLRGSKSLYQSGRPYSLPELQEFSRRFRIIRDAAFGRSQLYSLRTYAQSGRAQLRNHVLYQAGRREEWRELIRKLANDEGAELEKKTCTDQIVPTYSGDAVFDVADMIELLDHWHEPGEGPQPREGIRS